MIIILRPCILFFGIFITSCKGQKQPDTDFHIYVNDEKIDTRTERSVLSEWPEDWWGLTAKRDIFQWYVKIKEGVDVRSLEEMTGLILGLYFPHNGYLLVSSQVIASS